MTATQPPLAEGLPPDKPTFAALVRGTHTPQEFIKAASSHKGEPALQFTDQEVCDLSSPLRFALIGKFSLSRPSMDFLRRGFKTVGFQGDFTLGLMDPHHVLIRFALEDDYHRCWLHSTWKFRTHVMKVLKWTPDFSVKEEPPVVPIWISLEQLPLFLFARGPLFSIGKVIGRPLKIDAATLSLSRPSVARLCVEIDLRHQLPGRVWIGLPKGGFWQHINYDPLPEYCFDCCSLGHLQADCGKSQQLKPPEKKIWRPIGSQIQPDCVPTADDPVVNLSAQPQHSAVEKENMIQTNVNNQIVSDTPGTSSGVSPAEKDSIPTLPNSPSIEAVVPVDSAEAENPNPKAAPIDSTDPEADPLIDNAEPNPVNSGLLKAKTYAAVVTRDETGNFTAPSEEGNIQAASLPSKLRRVQSSECMISLQSIFATHIVQRPQDSDAEEEIPSSPDPEVETMVEVPIIVADNDEGGFQPVKPKKRGRPRKNKDRD